jgi:tripartite-type tricarboxylate transporter receptor subunit TctC
MPSAIVELLSDKIRKFQATPAYASLLDKAAMEPSEPLSATEMAEFVKKEYRRWTPAIQNSGAVVD